MKENSIIGFSVDDKVVLCYDIADNLFFNNRIYLRCKCLKHSINRSRRNNEDGEKNC